ncbi:M18 family aminopeptidase [Candidatus Poriferisocius sp.]|uniref:M18 family aminopeptidase n=1 Tax=Candidatus Poriferisocius sp. TaxID=3101276 RepID=UPI003B01385C
MAGDSQNVGVAGLISFIDACPTPFHVVERAAALLAEAGFTPMDEAADWSDASGCRYLCRGGSLVAWRHRTCEAGFRIIGAHTDSPNLRVTPRPDIGTAGFRQLGVEVYGGALLNSWLDRDLGVAGRVATTEGTRLFCINQPVLRVPQLAIHLDREVNQKGLLLNPQTHLVPLWGLGPRAVGEFAEVVAQAAGLDPMEVMAWDAMLHDLAPPTIGGINGEFLFAPRIDNQASCWAGLQAMLAAPADAVPSAVLCLFDHEEVGSTSPQGAMSTLLPGVLERIAGSRQALHPALAKSLCVSANGAHATHPNFAERHEPDHPVTIGGGPVIKRNANLRYATDAVGEAVFSAACQQAEVAQQVYIHRGDMPCGSTIGPFAAATTGVTTIDAGIPQLSMHSAREMCGVQDPVDFALALGAFLRSAS